MEDVAQNLEFESTEVEHENTELGNSNQVFLKSLMYATLSIADYEKFILHSMAEMVKFKNGNYELGICL